MPACAFISSILLALLTLTPLASANEPPPPVSADPAASSTPGRTQQAEEDDYRQTPYTSFGEFNDEEEAEDTRFFQYGRFFGVSLGVGYEGATGNRGALFTGGMPAVSLRVHYWFDFNYALTLGIYQAKHQFTGFKNNTGTDPNQRNDFTIFMMGAELRYYFETRDATAPITFAGPFILVGVGNYSKSETDILDPGNVEKDTAMGFSFGAGLEFPIRPRKSYLNLEGKFHGVTFADTILPVTTTGNKVLKDSSGLFFTVMASILFTY